MIVLIDNYDSFTFNLVHYFGELGADIVVHRNDKVTAKEVVAAKPDAIVLSPGPCTPKEAGICLDLIEEASATIPILGVCLGPSGDRRCLWWQSRACAISRTRQIVRHPPRRPRHFSRHQRTVQSDALPLTCGRARQHAWRTDRHRPRPTTLGDGSVAHQFANPRRAISSRKHRFGSRPSDAEEFSRHRRCLEFSDGSNAASPRTASPSTAWPNALRIAP